MDGCNGIVNFIQVEEVMMIKDKQIDGKNLLDPKEDLENGWLRKF